MSSERFICEKQRSLIRLASNFALLEPLHMHECNQTVSEIEATSSSAKLSSLFVQSA